MPEEGGEIIRAGDGVLVTGASGFIGSNVVGMLSSRGLTNLRCFIRSENVSDRLTRVVNASVAKIDLIKGDLLSYEDCERAVAGVKVIYHLAVSTQDKSFADAYRNSVETTRNLLDAAVRTTCLSRFVNISSFSVFNNLQLPIGSLLDESCPIEGQPELRGEPYCYAKIKQEELVRIYGLQHRIPFVIVRPGAVYGPGSREITGRVGILKSGWLIHLGGANIIPFTYVDNCAEAIMLAGLKRGIENEVINIVDDGLVTSREFLRRYKREVGKLKSIYIPKWISCAAFSLLGKGGMLFNPGLPSKYNRRRWSAYWKGNIYSNEKAKQLLGWTPRVSTEDGFRLYFNYCKELIKHAR